MSTRLTILALAVILALGAVLIPMSFAQSCDPSADYLQMGETAFNGGDYNGALTAYNCAVDLQPSPRTYNRRGWTHYQLGNYRAAYDDFTRAIELDPNYAYAYNNRGLVLYYWGDYAAAVADFDQALALNIPIEGVAENRANAAARLGESSSVLVATPTLQPTTETLNLGDIEKTPTPAATVTITPTPAFTPILPSVSYDEAEEAYRLGEYEDATTAFSLIEQDGNALFHRGYMYMVMGSYDYAAQFMTAAIEKGQVIYAPVPMFICNWGMKPKLFLIMKLPLKMVISTGLIIPI